MTEKKKFNVALTLRPMISTILEVEAESEDQAEEIAVNLLLNDGRYSVKDFDGNYIETTGDDVTVDHVDPTDRCSHEPDPASIQPADGAGRNRGTDGIIDVRCKKCGMSGSMRVDLLGVAWD